jgi:hypothetical protein
MDRKEFLKEMSSSLFQTVKNVYEPFIHDDLHKVEEVVDQTLGIKWVPLMSADDSNPKLEMKFMNGTPIIVIPDGANIHVLSGICHECSNIITVTTLYSTGKCLNCEKEYNFKTNQGDLALKTIPVKKKDHVIYIGFKE